MVASLGGNCPEFACADAIFVDMKVTKCKEDILGILFPVNEASQGHAGARRMEATTTNIQREELPADCCEPGKSSNVSSSNSASLQDLKTKALNVKADDLLINLGQFQKTFEAIEYGCYEIDPNSILFKSSAIKVMPSCFTF